MSYRNLLARLGALPKKERQLAAGVYYFRESRKRVCGCVLGKGLPGLRRIVRKPTLDTRIEGLCPLGGDVLDGMTLPEATSAQLANDWFDSRGSHSFDNSKPARRARYVHMIEWLRTRVEEEGNAPQAPTDSDSLLLRGGNP